MTIMHNAMKADHHSMTRRAAKSANKWEGKNVGSLNVTVKPGIHNNGAVGGSSEVRIVNE